MSTPHEVIEYVASHCVLQGPEVTKSSHIAVHQCPGLTPEEELNRREGNYKEAQPRDFHSKEISVNISEHNENCCSPDYRAEARFVPWHKT